MVAPAGISARRLALRHSSSLFLARQRETGGQAHKNRLLAANTRDMLSLASLTAVPWLREPFKVPSTVLITVIDGGSRRNQRKENGFMALLALSSLQHA